MLILVALVGLVCGAVSWWMGTAQRQQELIERLEWHGIHALRDYGVDQHGDPLEAPQGPEWILRDFVPDVLYSVRRLYANKPTADPGVFGLIDQLNLHELYVRTASRSGDLWLQAATHQSGLKQFSLSSGLVSEDARSTLGALTNLESLHFREIPIRGAHLPKLNRSTRLKRFEAYATHFDDAGMRQLGSIHALEQVIIFGEQVTDAFGAQNTDALSAQIPDTGIANLAGLPNLRELQLYGAQLTDQGLSQLKNLPRLETLTLGNAEKVGASDLSWLQNLPSLRKVTFVSCGVNSQTRAAGLSASSMAKVTLIRCPVRGEFEEHCQGTLRKLVIGKHACDAAALAEVGRRSNLVYLDLRGAKITDADMVSLESLHQLEHLDVRHTNLSGASLASISKLKKLKYLDLVGCSIRDNDLDHLRGLPLNTLRLGSLEFTVAGLAKLASVPLSELDLRACTIDDSFVPALKLTSSRWIYVSPGALSTAAIEALRMLGIHVLERDLSAFDEIQYFP